MLIVPKHSIKKNPQSIFNVKDRESVILPDISLFFRF